MATIFITDANSISQPAGVGLATAAGDTVYVSQSGHVLGGTNAIALAANTTLTVHGDIYGDDCVRSLQTGASTVQITVGATGSIAGETYGIVNYGSSLNPTTLRVLNLGTISTSQATSYGISPAAIMATYSDFRLVNSGTIASNSGDAIIASNCFTAEIVNSGTIIGDAVWFRNTASLSGVALRNFGTIDGNVTLTNSQSGQVALSIVNAGTITGDVTIGMRLAAGSGVLNLADGTIGRSLLMAGMQDTLTLVLDRARIGNDINGVTNQGTGNVVVQGAMGALISGTVITGLGKDSLTLTGAEIGGRVSLGGNADVLVMNAGRVLGDIDTGAGNDSVDVSGADVHGRVFLFAGNDTFTGGAGRDRVFDGLGADDILLGAGDDVWTITLQAAADGNDTVSGGSGTDRIDLSRVTLTTAGITANTGGVLVDLDEGVLRGLPSNTANLYGIDLIDGFEDVTGTDFADEIIGTQAGNDLRGGSGMDIVVGGAGEDTLRGDDGADLLQGNLGRDILIGGTGPDTFEFLSVAESPAASGQRDHILDYETGSDTLSLFLMDAQTAVSGVQSFTFAGNAFISAVGSVRWYQTAGNTIVEANTEGNNLPEFVLVLRGLHALTTADFVL